MKKWKRLEKTLWPYYQRKNKAFYRDGKNHLELTIKKINGKTFVIYDGEIPLAKINMPVGFTINLSLVEFVKK